MVKSNFFWLLIGLFIAQGVSAQSIKEASVRQSKNPTVTAPTQMIDVKGVSFTMVLVNGGSFMMGANQAQDVFDRDEKPAHKVVLKDYYIGKP